MRYTFKPHWLTTLATLILFPILISLGFWQLHRAEFKRELIAQYAHRSQMAPLNIADLNKQQDQRFYRLTVTGSFDNAHSLLIDNKIHDHQIGYELITPFAVKDQNKYLLVDRGWIAASKNRAQLPTIPLIEGKQTLTGILLETNPKSFQLGEDSFGKQWPWRVQTLPTAALPKLLGQPVYSYILSLEPQPLTARGLQPERHSGYAFQWFALAATLGLIYLFVNLKRHK